MAFVPAPNICMVEWRATRNLQKIENRIMVDMLGEPTSADIFTLIQACWNWWELTHAPHLHDSVLLNEVVGTSMHELNGAQRTYAPDTATTGEVGGGGLPNEVSLCVSLRTGVRGRSARGRFYVMAIADSQRADDNNVATGVASAFAADLNVLRNALDDLGWPMVIVSYQSEGVPRPGGPVYFPVTNCIVVDTVLDSMKSRKPGVGT